MKEFESSQQRFRSYIRPYALALVLSLLFAVVVGIEFMRIPGGAAAPAADRR